MTEFMRVCADNGKRFTVPPPDKSKPSLEIKIDDRRDHLMTPIHAKDEEGFISILQSKYAWRYLDKVCSGSVVMIRVEPTTSTTSEQIEDLLSSTCVLNIELTPKSWNISYIVPRAWPTSLKQLKQRHPERFHNAGKSTKRGSIFRRI